MSALFKKAVRRKQKARIAIHGPAKSGKTTGAIALARGLVGPSGRIAVVDTEHGSASKTCAGDHDFDVIEIDNFDPRLFIDYIQAAEKEGYDAIVIDSLSHEWIGRGGARELADNETAKSRSGNSFVAWAKVTPLHNAVVEAINRSACHVVATMRVKTEYVMEVNTSTGKTAPRKVGLAPVQREGMEYEFDILFSVDHDHKTIVEGSRYRQIDGKVLPELSVGLGEEIGRWLDEGEAAPAPVRPIAVAPEPIRIDHATTLAEYLEAMIALAEMSPEQVRTALSKRGVVAIPQLTRQQIEDMLGKLETLVYDKQFKATFPDTERADQAAVKRASILRTILGDGDQPGSADHAAAELATA